MGCSRYILFLIFLLPLTGKLFAQVTSGTMLDYDSKEPVAYVNLTVKRTMQSIQSDPEGHYRINARPGDTILISHPAYIFRQHIVKWNSDNDIIYVTKRRNKLEEVEILSDMAKYKRDSADKYTIYRKTLKDAGRQTEAGFNNGFAVSGLFSSLALGISGKKKKDKHFAKMLAADEQVKFTKVRYNKNIVMATVNTDEADAQNFIEHNPMPYDFVRAASDVEIRMWIRDNYKKWQSLPASERRSLYDTTGSK